MCSVISIYSDTLPNIFWYPTKLTSVKQEHSRDMIQSNWRVKIIENLQQKPPEDPSPKDSKKYLQDGSTRNQYMNMKHEMHHRKLSLELKDKHVSRWISLSSNVKRHKKLNFLRKLPKNSHQWRNNNDFKILSLSIRDKVPLAYLSLLKSEEKRRLFSCLQSGS